MARAWVDVLLEPRRFFATGVRPGDQAPGLTFAVAVATVFTLGWMVSDPAVVPGIAESTALSAAVVLAVVLALAAPVGLHLTAAVGTVSLLCASIELRDGVRFGERGGVSETVQIVAYASAPMALAGPAIPTLRVVCGVYATILLLVGVRIVHGTSPIRTLVAGVPPAVFGYGVGYRVIDSSRAVFGV